MNTDPIKDTCGAIITDSPEFPETPLKRDRHYADCGRGFAQLRMARRYRDGDGVPIDLNRARDYFLKAVAAGEAGASAELRQLDAQNPQSYRSLTANGSQEINSATT